MYSRHHVFSESLHRDRIIDTWVQLLFLKSNTGWKRKKSPVIEVLSVRAGQVGLAAAGGGAAQARTNCAANLRKGTGNDATQYCATNGDGGDDDDGQDDVFQGGHTALIAFQDLE